ncbi:MAG: DUF362 domain-containing protein [Dethiobacter sp.]|jgi:uncharacterized protein (DUF362 family)|nr:DUF362 domain-containing protein [Dethiobacter sp.]
MERTKAKVAVVATRDRRAGVEQSLKLLDSLDFQGKKVLIKPNFNTADSAPGSTHNDTLKALALWLREKGASKLTIGERSYPLTSDVMQEKKIPELALELGLEIINFDELGEDGFVHFKRPDLHWKDGFLIPRAVIEAESLVCTCCLKTHGHGGVFTMALKLAVGMVPIRGHKYMPELHSSPHMRKMIAEINTAFTPAVVVMDGVEAFVDGGPATGTRKAADVFLAGSDRIAIDAVGLAVLKKLGSNKNIMDTPIFAQEQIARAVELGLGVSSPRDIELVAADEASRAYAQVLQEILQKEE